MYSVVISCEQERINRIIDEFGFDNQHRVLSKDTSEQLIRRILTAIKTLRQGSSLRIRFAAAKGEETRFFDVEEIHSIESIGRVMKLNFVSSSGKPDSFEFYGVLSKVEDVVSGLGFIRIHQSYIISLEHISSYGARQVSMENGQTFTIGRKYMEAFREAMKNSNAIKLN